MYIETHASDEHRNTDHHDHADVPAALSDQDSHPGDLEANYFPPAANDIRNVEQLNAFFTENFDAIGRTVRGRCFRTPDQSDEVTQELYPRMLRFLEQSSDGFQEPWAVLSTIARHLAIDELRRSATRSRRLTPLYEDTFLPPTQDYFSTIEFDETTRDLLHDAINLLGDRERHVISEIFLNGKRGRQVARELGLSDSYIAEVKAAGLANLREYLRDRFPEIAGASPRTIHREN